MKNKLYIAQYFLILTALFFTACDKTENFDYDIHEIEEGDIDSVVFAPNHYITNADGKSQLKLNLKLYKVGAEPFKNYRTGEMEMRRTEYPIITSRLPKGAVEYYYQPDESNEVKLESNFYIPSTETKAGNIKVFAKVFGEKTNEYDVEIRKPLEENDLYKEKNIPVIFHVIEFEGKKNTEFTLSHEHIMAKLNKLNDAFRRKKNISANGCDTRVNFVAAEKALDGAILQNAGMHVYKIGAETIEDTYDYETVKEYYDEIDGKKVFKFTKYLKEKSLIWDNKKYLNVWIIPTKNSLPRESYPTVVLKENNTIEGIEWEEIETDKDNYKVEELGLLINYNALISTDVPRIMGEYLGLLPTGFNNEPEVDSDFCDDTFMYEFTRFYDSDKLDPKKNMLFRSDNIMDDESQSITISTKQAKRIHHVLNYCPTRMMWK